MAQFLNKIENITKHEEKLLLDDLHGLIDKLKSKSLCTFMREIDEGGGDEILEESSDQCGEIFKISDDEIKNPTMPTYFTNRALCHLKLKRWDSSCQDCRKALDMDSNLVKGHFFLGQALLEMENYDEAIKHLQRANDLAKEQKLNFGDDIASQLRIARKKRWNVQEEKRITQEIELLTYLTKLINDDAARQVEKIKLNMEDLNLDFVQDRIMEIEGKCENSISELNSLFAKIDDRRRKRDVPDFLCGKISFEILREPVITPSGITYERKDIEEHLQRVGHFDPVTRVKLTQDQLIPNFAMKDVVDNFLQENEWALDY